MYRKYIRGRKVPIWFVTALIIGLLIPLVPQQAAAFNSEIRVALFVDIGSAYQGTVPIVTLKGTSALQLQGESSTFQNIRKESQLRFSVDQYFLIVRETDSLSEARQVAKRLTDNGFHNAIVSLNKQNKTVYQVVTGSEASRAGITKVQTEVKSETQYDSHIAGSFRVQAGSFSSLEQAEARLTEIQGQGYPAFITQVLNQSQVSFEVWVGQEDSEEASNSLQNSLQQKFPNITFSQAHAEEYIIIQNSLNDASNNLSYILTAPQQKLTISPVATGSLPLMTVEERSNRQYRGKIELSRYQNKFTVVNVLPLEEYLYSVVGTEMSTGWPIEALKTQAVMSRNYAYMNIQANKYGIAHLSDTTFEQAYHGYSREAADVRQAVDSTKGEFLTYKGQIFSTFYHSNAGGKTARGSEVWGDDLVHHSSATSNDNYPETVQVLWYRIQDNSGRFGYVSSEYINKTSQKSKLGYEIGTVNVSSGSLNFRSGPSTAHDQIGTLNAGERVTIIGQVRQNNAYSWVTGPYTGSQLSDWINNRSVQTQPIIGPVQSLEVTKRGDSGRVMQMKANGQVIQTSSPDAHRSVFKDGTVNVRSTKFEVEAMGDYTILAAGGRKVETPQSSGSGQIYAIQGEQVKAVNGSNDQFAIMDRSGVLRISSKLPAFRLHGNGFGHGLGASQFGVRAMAIDGYDYRQILQHYFHKDALIEKKY